MNLWQTFTFHRLPFSFITGGKIMSTKKHATSTGATTSTTATLKTTEASVQQEPETGKNKTTYNSPEDYSSSSLIARAYSAGYFPSFTHQRLFHAIVKMLDGKDEGSIDFNELLTKVQMHRSSALQIIRHMCNWGILTVAFNSSHVIGEGRKSWVSVKIIRNLESKKDTELPKSA